MNKVFTLIAFLFFSVTTIAQSSLNNYQYVLVPSKFKFLKEKDPYQMSSIIKKFFEGRGFKAFLDDETIPDEVLNNSCNKIYLDLEENNSMFVTKIKLIGKDCKGTVLINSQEGTSREKDYKIAYYQSLVTVLKSIDLSNYKFNGETVSQNNGVAETKSTIVAQNEVLSVGAENKNNDNLLTAERVENGYLLIDSNNSIVVLKLLKTSIDTVFIATSKAKNGIVIKRDNSWILEYYENSKLIAEKLNVNL
jgi:hypothetical protein